MPVEIRELIIKATVAIDWDNHSVKENKENIVCLTFPTREDIKTYVKGYLRRHNTKTPVLDQSKLSAFLIEWQASLLK